MIEKVNKRHPDKVADCIAGAIVDYCYFVDDNPKVACEVLIGHGYVTIITESSVDIPFKTVRNIVNRLLSPEAELKYIQVPQDIHLSDNQQNEVKCGDNGIFKGVPMTEEEKKLEDLTNYIYSLCPSDGKYVLDEKNNKLIICQSKLSKEYEEQIKQYCDKQNLPKPIINPLGYWEGGYNTDSGATNRKLGSDMYQSVTGGGLHGKDLSKADVSVNIYAWLKAQKANNNIEFSCAIGDTEIDGVPYKEIVNIAREFISNIGGFEKFAENGYSYKYIDYILKNGIK